MKTLRIDKHGSSPQLKREVNINPPMAPDLKHSDLRIIVNGDLWYVLNLDTALKFIKLCRLNSDETLEIKIITENDYDENIELLEVYNNESFNWVKFNAEERFNAYNNIQENIGMIAAVLPSIGLLQSCIVSRDLSIVKRMEQELAAFKKRIQKD